MFGPPGRWLSHAGRTLPCLVEAFKGVPGGRAPGSDGRTYAALRAFWPVLGQLLVDSCNEAFASTTEEALMLTRSQRSGVRFSSAYHSFEL